MQTFAKARPSLYQRFFHSSAPFNGDNAISWNRTEVKGLNPLFQAAHRSHQNFRKDNGSTQSWRQASR